MDKGVGGKEQKLHREKSKRRIKIVSREVCWGGEKEDGGKGSFWGFVAFSAATTDFLVDLGKF